MLMRYGYDYDCLLIDSVNKGIGKPSEQEPVNFRGYLCRDARVNADETNHAISVHQGIRDPDLFTFTRRQWKEANLPTLYTSGKS